MESVEVLRRERGLSPWLLGSEHLLGGLSQALPLPGQASHCVMWRLLPGPHQRRRKNSKRSALLVQKGLGLEGAWERRESSELSCCWAWTPRGWLGVGVRAE